jgi:Mg/Co/Ni transporter MgtE
MNEPQEVIWDRARIVRHVERERVIGAISDQAADDMIKCINNVPDARLEALLKELDDLV